MLQKNHTDIPLKITPKAQEAIENIMQQKGIGIEYGLRVGIKGSGCMENYLLGFDVPQANDLVYQYDNITILIQKSQLMYVINKTIHYLQDENGVWGFKVMIYDI
jgi:iron-sulfur cluster assembly protein